MVSFYVVVCSSGDSLQHLTSLLQPIVRFVDMEFSLAQHLDVSKEVEEAVFAFYKTVKVDEDSKPFLCSSAGGRQPALCNYVATLKKTFVSHDVYADESLKYLSALNGPQFYAGSPVVVHGQVLASLCAIDFRPRTVSCSLPKQRVDL